MEASAQPVRQYDIPAGPLEKVLLASVPGHGRAAAPVSARGRPRLDLPGRGRNLHGRAGAAKAARGHGDDLSSQELEGLDPLWARVQEQAPGFQSLSLRLPSSADGPWTFDIDTSSGARRPDKRAQLTLDAKTGEVVRFEPYESQSRGRKIVGWMRFIHTGEAFGFPGQTIAGIVSAGGAVLAYTGLALTLRRLLAWRQRRAASPVDASPAPETATT